MQALFALHRGREAEDILARLAAGADSDARANDSIGMALAGAGQYDKAERYFSRALEAEPGNWDVLYSLGLAAARADHDERARDILQSALRRRPENVDVLYNLAAVNARLGQRETAVQLLAEAARQSPGRADVQQLLARMTADLGYFSDAIQAWDRYLKLVPGDGVARRERAFAASAIGEETDRSLAELKAYASRHPDDAVGHYELGIAEASAAPEDALMQLNRALALKPDLPAALVARGLLQLKRGNYRAALPDFGAALKREPNNAAVLDRLGQCYMAVDRLPEAIPVLRRAVELAPRDSKALMHLGRALTDAGQEEEARKVFARFRELGPDKSSLPHPAGLVEFLNLSSADQMARYRAGVERTVCSNPGNAEAQVRYLKLLLEDGKANEALAAARRILELAPGATLLAEAGNALLSAGQWSMAQRFLERTAAGDRSGAVALSLAIATSRAVNAQAGIAQLDRIPEPRRNGDYYLARAQMLDAAGRPEEASAALNQGLRANPTRADLYRYAANYLMQKQRTGEAVALVDHAAAIEDKPDILLMRAVVLQAAGRTGEAEQALRNIENWWPDWYNVWLARAILSAWQGRTEAAQRQLRMAAALGGGDAEQRFAAAAQVSGTAANGAPGGVRLMQALFP